MNCRAVRKRDVVGKLTLRRKVFRNVLGDFLKMLRLGLLPALRCIGSASAGGCNPSWGSMNRVLFLGSEGNRDGNRYPCLAFVGVNLGSCYEHDLKWIWIA